MASGPLDRGRHRRHEPPSTRSSPVPGDFPNEEQHEQYAYQLWNFSSGQDSRQGGWASGPTPDGRAEFGYVEEAVPMAMEPMLPAGDPRLYNTGSPPGPRPRRPSRTWSRRSPRAEPENLPNHTGGRVAHRPPARRLTGRR
jgi:hypothetical protein